MADAETGSKPVDQKALAADIDRTRADLARTIDAISDRISDRVSPKKNVERVADQLRKRASQIDPVVAGAAAAAVVIGVSVLLLLRRRKR
jgi:type VI protein secretion system component VasF